MTTELVELADSFEVERNRDFLGGYFHDERTRETLGEAAKKLRALASRAGGWISVKDRLPAYGVPVLVGWTRAPWLKEPTPAVYAQTVCRDFAGDDSWSWFEWQGGKWPVGDDCEWDSDDAPTHWQQSPEPPAAPEPVAVGL